MSDRSICKWCGERTNFGNAVTEREMAGLCARCFRGYRGPLVGEESDLTVTESSSPRTDEYGDSASDSIDPRHKLLVAWLNRMRKDSGLASPIIWRTPRPEDDFILELFPFILGRPNQETNEVQYYVEECSLLIADRAVKSLVSLLESPDQAASRNAAAVLKRLGPAAYHAIPDLKKLVAEKKGVIQEQSRAIMKMIERAVPLADLSAEDPHLRVNAAELLARCRCIREIVVPRLTAALDDPDADVRQAVQAALARLDAPA